VTADFIWRMEAVLELYAEPYDPKRPVVCFDERPYQMVADVHAPLPAAPGRARREDYAYERRGVCNLYMVFEPLRRRRWVRVTARRTAEDFAWQMKWLVDEVYPEADVVRVVLDNLNCHTPAALYRVFPAAEARRLVRRLEFVYTPKHASWLNMAEIEFSVLSRQCLGQRLSDIGCVRRAVEAWACARDASGCGVDWRFGVWDAREKLRRLYPK